MEAAVAESVLPGPARNRRAQYQFGGLLPRGPRGQVDIGICKSLSRGTVSLIPPTRSIKEPIETHTIDGVEIVFQLAPQTEAPAEMHMFYPGLPGAESGRKRHPHHAQLYPIRGAEVRDANAWAQYLNEALDRFGRDTDVVFAQHQWPVWGNQRVLDYLGKQRDLVQVPARSDRAPDEPRVQGGRDRRAARTAEEPRKTSGTCAATTGRSART